MSSAASVSRDSPLDPASEALVKRLFARIGEISTLPVVALRIMEVASNPKTGADELLESVRFDAALVLRIMRTINSSFYALQNKVADLKLAITLLGFKEIRNLALTAYVAQLFKRSGGHGQYRREQLWTHLVSVASVARWLADRTGRVAPSEAYLAGLLHDLGLILIDQYLHKPFCELIDTLSQAPQDATLCEVEAEVLGFDHTQLGEYVASQWNLPEHLTAAIRYHHSPAEYGGAYQAMVYTVALADFFCSLKGVTALGVCQPSVPPAEVFHGLGLGKREVAEIWEHLDEVLQSAHFVADCHDEPR